MAALRAQCERFMIGKDSQNRANQNNQMLQECIWGLLTLRAQHYLAQYEAEYTVNGLGCGPLLLNIIRRTVTGIGQHTLMAQASETPSKKGIVQAKVPQSSHRSRNKTTITNIFTITLTFTANICHGKQLSTQHCPSLRLTAKTNFS